LREGYHTALMKGQYPVTFLFVEMDPAEVDVNVHPAKREVRFRDAAMIREALSETVRLTLESVRTEWSETFRASPPPARPEPASHAELPLIPEREQTALRRDWADWPASPAWSAPAAPPAAEAAKPLEPVADAGVPTERTAAAPGDGAAASAEPAAVDERRAETPKAAAGPMDFKIIGVLGKLYVLMENSTGLVLVDQHAAHERILFEEMRRRMESQGVPTQRLLLPITLQVPPKDADWLTRNLDLMERAGLALEPFGPGIFKIDALPTFLRASDPAQLLRDVIDELRETGAQSSKLRLGEDMIAKTVCRHAVKANDVLREAELVRLVQDLMACDLPYCCPHGRPTMIQISYQELEKKFGRKV